MAPPPKPPLDPVCVVALVVALVLGWCPVVGSIAAIVLAGIGIRRVAASAGARRGLAVAWAAIGLGVLIPLVEGLALERLQTAMVAEMDRTATDTIARTLRGDDALPGRWLPESSGGATAEERRAFAAGLSARLGALRDVRITDRTATQVLDPIISATFIAEFERGNAFGNAVFVTGPLESIAPSLIARSIELDVSGTRVTIPARTAGTAEHTP